MTVKGWAEKAENATTTLSMTTPRIRSEYIRLIGRKEEYIDLLFPVTTKITDPIQYQKTQGSVLQNRYTHCIEEFEEATTPKKPPIIKTYQ